MWSTELFQLQLTVAIKHLECYLNPISKHHPDHYRLYFQYILTTFASSKATALALFVFAALCKPPFILFVIFTPPHASLLLLTLRVFHEFSFAHARLLFDETFLLADE